MFLGGGAPYLYAFDKAAGAEVCRGATPFRTHANPMTYRARDQAGRSSSSRLAPDRTPRSSPSRDPGSGMRAGYRERHQASKPPAGR